MLLTVQLAVVRECNQAAQPSCLHASVLHAASFAAFGQSRQTKPLRWRWSWGQPRWSAYPVELYLAARDPASAGARIKTAVLTAAEGTGLSRGARPKRGYPRGRASRDGTSSNNNNATFHP